MNISRLNHAPGAGPSAPRVGKADVRPPSYPVAKPAQEMGVRADAQADPAQTMSPRLAAFEQSIQGRIDHMAASGKLSERQLEALQDVKEKLGSMMSRFNQAFFDGEGSTKDAGDVLSHILELTAQSLETVLPQAHADDGAGANQRQFAFGSGSTAFEAPGHALDTVA